MLLSHGQLEEFSRLSAQGKSDWEIALALNISETMVMTLRHRQMPEKSSPEVPAPQQMQDQSTSEKGEPPISQGENMAHKKGVTRNIDGEAVARALREGMRPIDVEEKFGISGGTVGYYAKKFGVKSQGQLGPRPKTRILKLGGNGKRRTLGEIADGRKPTEKRHDMAKERKRILALRERGLSIADIATKLGMHKSLVSYRLYSQGPKSEKSKELVEHGHIATTTNGTGPQDRNIRVGYALAKVEDFIRYQSERVGIPEDVLKQRLSKLLGRDSLREGAGTES